jgi:predicted HAD superfamily Cof-like phosphohydrolase
MTSSNNSKTNKDQLSLLVDFMTAMGQPVSQGWEDLEGIKLGLKLIEEETEEFRETVENLFENTEWGEGEDVLNDSREDLAKELVDILYVCHWTAAKIGIDTNEAFRRVHASNMSKLGPDGKPVKREDGKVLKGPGYHAPDLSDIVRNVPVTLA